MFILPRIKELRIEHHQTQKDIAKLLNISISKYYRIESIKSGIIRMDQLEVLAEHYNCSINYIISKRIEISQ